MKIHSLTSHNFMPYKEKLEMVFPQDDYRNVMIVFGDNMRGKTSILNALRWVFYGEAVGRHSRPIPLQEIVNKDATLEDNWKVEVHVKFEANGCSYDLRRIADRKRQVAYPSKPEDFTESIHLIRDGSVVPGDRIEAEIGLIVPKQTSRFFLFDGELLQEYETLLIEDSQKGDQIKQSIEQVLGVPALTNGRVDIQTILKKAQKQQSADLKQIAGLEKQAERHTDLTEKIDALDRDIKKLEEDLKKVREERVTLNDEVEAAQSVIGAKAKLDEKRKDQKFLISECNKKKEESLNLMSKAWKDLIDAQIQIRRSQLEQRQKALLNSIKKQSELEKKVADLKQLLDTSECVTCGQTIGEERRSQVGDALGKAEADLRSIEDSSSVLQDIYGKLDALSKIRGTNVKDQLRQVQKDIQGHQVRLTQIENEIEKFKDEIAGYDTAEIKRKHILLSEKIKEEGRLQNDIQVQEIERKKHEEDLAVSQKAIEGLTKNRTQRSIVKASLCSNLEKVFSQSIEQLRDKLRERVEALANEAFKQMITQKSYQGLEINDNYGLQIVGESGHYVTVRSAGAEQIVAFSLIDGLNRTGRSSGPVIMDTPFGRLDLKHRDNILRYLPSVTSQFVLLVHSGEIRRDTDLTVIADRIWATYEIKEISSTQSRLERTLL